ncbi:hypothetical protein NDU88_004454 [Pleurodeles waltl]|uniref:Uncharacterized protein n=1 Tax=Pleurodeles waltl TaxID=8319 RepID=A0AAV7RHE5_PLEWA|nr:hypothetical protein NDU88_004454 [Pleurodeles waltl]
MDRPLRGGGAKHMVNGERKMSLGSVAVRTASHYGSLCPCQRECLMPIVGTRRPQAMPSPALAPSEDLTSHGAEPSRTSHRHCSVGSGASLQQKASISLPLVHVR